VRNIRQLNLFSNSHFVFVCPGLSPCSLRSQLNPNFLMPRCIVLRADNQETIFLDTWDIMSQVSRNIVSSLLYPTPRQRRRPQTFGLRDRWRSGTRTWMHCRSFIFPSNFMAKCSIQSCTTVFTSHTSSLCEAVCTLRHPYRDP
jgi:hypothetical protein